MVVYEEGHGGHILRIHAKGEGYLGTLDALGASRVTLEGHDIDSVRMRLWHYMPLGNPGYFGIEGAKTKFFSIYPLGFHDPGYVAAQRHHVDRAICALAAFSPLPMARRGDVHPGQDVAIIVDSLMLGDANADRMRQILETDATINYVRGASRFADDHLSEGLKQMESAASGMRKVTWPMVTWLASLWLPDEHMLLDPPIAKDFASRVGHDFAHEYEDGLYPDVYRSMLDLAQYMRSALADMSPRDMIDMHNFMWTVGRHPVTT